MSLAFCDFFFPNLSINNSWAWFWGWKINSKVFRKMCHSWCHLLFRGNWLLDLHSRFTPGSTQRPRGLLEMEPGSATWKASTIAQAPKEKLNIIKLQTTKFHTLQTLALKEISFDIAILLTLIVCYLALSVLITWEQMLCPAWWPCFIL